MRVLVTGGAGFIGSHLVDRLVADGHDVRVLDSLDEQVHSGEVPEYLNPSAEFIRGDVRDREAVGHALAGVDRLVHLAAAVGVGQSMYEIERYTSVNALGAAVVLQEALGVRDTLEKVIVASSMSIYGEGMYHCSVEGTSKIPPLRDEAQLRRRDWELLCADCGAPLVAVPTPESKPLQPTSIYAIGKRDHEEMFLAWGRAYDVPATALRFFNVYGSRQALSNPYTGVAAIFASRLLNGRPPVVYEDGGQTRDFVHVSDIVAGVAASLEPGRGDYQALNLGTGVATSVREVAELMARLLEADVLPEIRGQYRAGDIRHCIANIDAATRALGFVPQVGFQDGMSGLTQWLAGQEATDLVDKAEQELARRDLTR